MDIKTLVKRFKEELSQCLSCGIMNCDLSAFQQLKETYLEKVDNNRVLSALKDAVDKLLGSKSNDRIKAFLELNELLQKLSTSLLSFKQVGQGVKLELPELDTLTTRYNEIKNLKKSLELKQGNRLALIRESLAHGTYKTHQLLPYFIDNATESYGEVSQVILDEVLPFYGRNATFLLRETLSYKSSKSQERIVRFLLKHLTDSEKRELVSDLLQKGDVELKKFVLRNADPDFFKIEDLRLITTSRSRELKDLAQAQIEKYS